MATDYWSNSTQWTLIEGIWVIYLHWANKHNSNTLTSFDLNWTESAKAEHLCLCCHFFLIGLQGNRHVHTLDHISICLNNMHITREIDEHFCYGFLTFIYLTLGDVMTTDALAHMIARIVKPQVYTLFWLWDQFLWTWWRQQKEDGIKCHCSNSSFLAVKAVYGSEIKEELQGKEHQRRYPNIFQKWMGT